MRNERYISWSVLLLTLPFTGRRPPKTPPLNFCAQSSIQQEALTEGDVNPFAHRDCNFAIFSIRGNEQFCSASLWLMRDGSGVSKEQFPRLPLTAYLPS